MCAHVSHIQHLYIQIIVIYRLSYSVCNISLLSPIDFLLLSGYSAGHYQHPEVVEFTAVPGDAVVCGGCRLEMSCSILRQETAANLPQPELEWIFNGSRLTELEVRMGIGYNSEQVAGFTAGHLRYLPSICMLKINK